MSAEVESLFYVSNDANERFVPWHGLGTAVEDAPNSKDAIKLAGLDWKVQSNPIYDKQGIEIPHYRANTRDKDSSVLGIVSDKYKIVQNEDAFEFTDSLLLENVRYETAGSLRSGKTVWLLAQLPKTKILGEDFGNYICFMNTHDGTGSIRVCMTPVRVVCNNTLNLALNTAKRSWSTKHMGDMQSKLAEAKHTLNLASRYMTALDEEADKLANIKVTDAKLEQIFNELYPIDYNKDTQRKIEGINQMKANIIKCYEMPDIAQFKGTAWGAINAITDFVDHAAPARMTENYQENNWGRIINGHVLVDSFYKKLIA